MQNELWEILQENGELIAEFCQVTARLAGVDHQMPPPPPPLLGDLAQNEQVIIRFLEAKLVRFDTEVGLQIDDIELKTDQIGFKIDDIDLEIDKIQHAICETALEIDGIYFEIGEIDLVIGEIDLAIGEIDLVIGEIDLVIDT